MYDSLIYLPEELLLHRDGNISLNHLNCVPSDTFVARSCSPISRKNELLSAVAPVTAKFTPCRKSALSSL